MKKQHLFLILAILFTATSCVERCHKFPDELKAYFPYAIGDTLIFSNQNSETLIFRTNNIIASEAYTQWDSKCGCSSNLYFEAANAENSIRGYIDEDCYDDHKYIIQLNINDSYFSYSSSLQKKSLDTLVMDNQDNYIDKIKIVKGKGLTEIHQHDGIKWEVK